MPLISESTVMTGSARLFWRMPSLMHQKCGWDVSKMWLMHYFDASEMWLTRMYTFSHLNQFRNISTNKNIELALSLLKRTVGGKNKDIFSNLYKTLGIRLADLPSNVINCRDSPNVNY